MTHINDRHGQALRSTGKALFWIGMVGVCAALGLRSALPAPVLMALVWGLVILTFIGIAVMHRGRKLLATSGEARLATDPRKPVVYLRSFAADSLGAGAVSSWPLLKFGYFTDEEQLAAVMNELGPFVAIGDPREALPDLGAERIYVREGDWQQRVQQLLRDACLVVLRAATTENFWWEFQTVRTHVAPERVLLLVSTAGASYEAFRTRAAEILPSALPELARSKRRLGHLRAIIAFDQSWQGHEIPIVRSFRRARFTEPLVGPLKLTLKPIYERLGVPWIAPPIATKKLIVLWTSGSIAALAFALVLAISLPEYCNSPPDDTPVQVIPTNAVTPAATDAVATPVTGRSPVRSTYDTQLAILTARLSSRPEFRERVNGMSDGQARDLGQQLALRGLRRLSNDDLVARARVVGRILSLSDTATCAAIVSGRPAPGLETSIRQLPDDDMQQWLDMVFESTVAELEHRTAPTPPTRPRVDQALASLSSRLSPEDADVLRHVLADPTSTSADQSCKAGRLLYGTLSDLSANDRAVLARALVIH